MSTFSKELSNTEFSRLSNFIYNNYGIKMPPAKKVMLQARLQSRLRETNIENFKDYLDYVFSSAEGENEIIKMIDVVSTNKTDFFRESNHFDFLKNKFLPEFYSENQDRELKIWSSACSSGEEVYTLAITLFEYFEKRKPSKYSILGTDISTRILDKAINAIYSEDRINLIPFNIKRDYFLKSKNRENPTVRIVPHLRQNTEFKRLNLMDEIYNDIPYDFDLVFCRNVLIYFDRPTQEKVIKKLTQHLKPGGYFFLGHSESITGMNLPLKQIIPTIFKKI